MSLKRELRTLVRQRKAAHSPDELHALSEKSCRGVCRSPLWQASRSVLLYHPLPDEVDVSALLTEAHRLGRRVYLPVVTGAESIEVRRWTPNAAMRTGAFGILEPSGQDIGQEEYAGIDLAIVPGMGFDSHGHRLGRGKGYYDRLLRCMPSAHLMGVCFPFQILPEIPHEAHDIDMEAVICGDLFG